MDLGTKLLAAGIFLALEVPLGIIAFRATHRVRPQIVPAVLLALAVALPDEAWGGLSLFLSLFSSFVIAISARAQRTRLDEERQLAASGPSPWLGQSRRSSLALIGGGTALMLVGMLADTSARGRSIPAILLFAWGSIMLGMGLFRRHTVLVHYLGRRRARWLELVQVTSAFVAYGFAAASDFPADAHQRLTLRLLSFLPFAVHFLVVWLPLTKAQERPVIPETPYA